ncbi:MAG: amino acid ABC transporter permease [Acidimicrobiaceae bacterium]|nr:amino acid ABC transporter permease [Acidimicrobiaceae bacterium]
MSTVVMSIDWTIYRGDLFHALIKTLEYTVLGFTGAVVLGLVLALMRTSPLWIVRFPAAVYTELFKNIPLLAIIFVTYFGLASQGIRLDALMAGSLSLVIFYAAYLSEIFRAALGGVPPGQQEGAQALGMSRIGCFRLVIVPQALRLALPGTSTMLVDLLKSTSLLVTIAAGELMTQAQLIASETFQALNVYVVIAAIYFAVCYPLSQLLLFLERRVRAGTPLTPWRRRRVAKAKALLAVSVIS